MLQNARAARAGGAAYHEEVLALLLPRVLVGFAAAATCLRRCSLHCRRRCRRLLRAAARARNHRLRRASQHRAEYLMAADRVLRERSRQEQG